MTPPLPVSRRRIAAFSLIELLVALAVFAALAAAAYGGLAEVARARSALAEREDRFADIVRTLSAMERDLRQAASRPVRGSERNQVLPALAGSADRVELTRLGFANPRAETRSNLERVAYALDDRKLERGRYPVLDRAPSTIAQATVMLDRVDALHLRYAGTDGIWRETWPPAEVPAGSTVSDPNELLPRAVEVRIVLADYGELRRVVELPSSFPDKAAEAP